jgi:hypothetical protein
MPAKPALSAARRWPRGGLPLNQVEQPMRSALAVLLLSLGSFPLLAQDAGDEAAVRRVLVDAYVEGLHANRDLAAVKSGFHPDFIMHVYDDGTLIQAPLAMWLDRLQLDGTKNPKPIDHQLDLLDITGNSAVAKLRIFEDGKHIYTDYFGLYKFDGGWKIVNKIFYGHD